MRAWLALPVYFLKLHKPLLQELRARGVAPGHVGQALAAFPANGRDFDFAQHRPPTANRQPLTADSNDAADLLTSREEEILRLMGDGLTNQEIANQLVISLYTVKRHATNIYNKLSVANRRQAVRTAQQLGIFPSK